MIIYDIHPYYENIRETLGDQYDYSQPFDTQVRRMGFKSFRYKADIPNSHRGLRSSYRGAYEINDYEFTLFALRFG